MEDMLNTNMLNIKRLSLYLSFKLSIIKNFTNKREVIPEKVFKNSGMPLTTRTTSCFEHTSLIYEYLFL